MATEAVSGREGTLMRIVYDGLLRDDRPHQPLLDAARYLHNNRERMNGGARSRVAHAIIRLHKLTWTPVGARCSLSQMPRWFEDLRRSDRHENMLLLD